MPVNRKISPEQWQALALKLNVEPSALQAVAQVESAGDGFMKPPDDRPKILFEGHTFKRLTGGMYDLSNPTISYPYDAKRNKIFYAMDQWKRLEEASALNRPAAVKSASWGMFQIMGFNYAISGFNNVEDFVTAMMSGADAQLEAFSWFLKTSKCVGPLQRLDWSELALNYNGKDYAAGNYHGKMKAAYERIKAMKA